jgi:hypothetical protein
MARREHERKVEERMARGRLARRQGDVAGDLSRLQGKSRNDLVPDHERAASSPLGARRMEKEKRR